MSVVRDESGLIVPRKLPNPCLGSPNVRDLNRQIKWNAKTGMNVLNKTELEKVLDRQRRVQVEKEREKEEEELVTPFQQILADRAKRLQQIEKEVEDDDENDEASNPAISNVVKKSSMFEQSSPHLLKLPLPVRKYSDNPRTPQSKISTNQYDVRKTKSCGPKPRWNKEQERSEQEQGWGGNSSGSSSKSSSPEPESEFLKVFAQLRGPKAATE